MSRFSRGLVVWVTLLACLMQAPPVLVGAPAKAIVIGVPSIPPTADPHQFTAPIPTIFQHNVFDALLELDPDGNLQPSLAISWKRLNNTAWEYKLRPNVRFHNGQLLSAEDVKFTYTRGADTKNPLTVGVSPRITTLERVEVVDASTVRFHLGSPDAGWERKTAVLKIIPAKHYEALGERQAALRPVGTGAFSVSRFVPGEVVVLEAATSSWRGRPKLQRIELRSIPETTVRASALKAGDVQMVVAISPDEVALLRQAGFIVATGELARV